MRKRVDKNGRVVAFCKKNYLKKHLFDPQYLGVQSLDASGVVLRFWVKVAEKDIYAGTRALNRELLLGFRRLGVECPYPQMDIHTK